MPAAEARESVGGVWQLLREMMMNIAKNGLFTLFAFAAMGAVAAEYICFVATDGEDAEGRGTSDAPFSTVEYAVSSAKTAVAADVSGATTGVVNVAAGEYVPTGMMTLDSPVQVIGAGADKTILHGGSFGRLFYLKVDGARVEELTVTGCNGGGSAVRIDKGLVKDCVITNNANSSGSATGGGVYMEGGTLEGCLVAKCRTTSSSGYMYGSGVYVKNGLVTGCEIRENIAHGNGHGTGIYLAGGTLERSRICFNDHTAVENAGGTVKNCLVYGNYCKAKCGWGFPWLAGVYQTSGKLYNCTIVANTNSASAVGCAGLQITGGTAENNIVIDNPSNAADVSFSSTVAAFNNNILDGESAKGVGNIVADPLFRDAAANDYRLGYESPAIRKGKSIAEVTDDFDGRARAAVSEIGAYAYAPSAEGALRCRIMMSKTGFSTDDVPTAYAITDGAGADGATISWYLDGGETPFTTGDMFIWDAVTIGKHSLSVVVTPAEGDPVRCDVADAFEVFGLQREVYVDKNGGDVYPYNTPANAAKDFASALSAIETGADFVTKVHVAAGTYDVLQTLTLSTPFQILGTNAEVTVLNYSSYTAKRAMTITHGDVRIEGVTIKNCKNGDVGAGVNMTTGTVANCIFSGCTHNGRDLAGGSAIYMTGGLVTNCLFTGCTSAPGHGYGFGSAVRQAGGRIDGCRFSGNTGGNTAYDGALYITKGIVSRSVFTKNDRTPIYNDGGTVENCLVYGNTCSVKSGWSFVYLAGVNHRSGTIRNCTIVDNVNDGSAVGCAGLLAAGGTVVNNIVWNNTAVDGTSTGYSFGSGATVNSNLLDTAYAGGSGNLSSDPFFADAANNDYHLVFGSPAIDHGAEIAGVTIDFDGVSRPQRSGWDIGCYENFSTAMDLMVNLVFSQSEYGPGESVTIGSAVDGPDLSGLTYEWTVDGVVVAGAEEDSITIPDAAIGEHTVGLTVSNGAGDTQAAEAGTFKVRPSEVFVSLTGSNDYPYDSWQTAATNVNEAFATLWKMANTTSVIHIAEGEYPVSEAMIINTPFAFAGAGVDRTVLKAAKSGYRCMQIGDPDANVSGITVSGFTSPAVTGAGVYISGGTFRDSRVTRCNCTMYDGSEGGGIRIAGGTVTNCEIDNNKIVQAHGYAHGGGVLISKGTLENCIIHDNRTDSFAFGEGLEATGGTVRNCVIAGSTGGSYNDAALYMEGGATVELCTVTGNVKQAVRLVSGTLRNALIVNNSTNLASSSVLVSGGKMYNCTLADNGKDGTAAADLTITGGTVKNCIALSATTTGGTVEFNSFNADPHFKNAARGDYRLASASPCLDAGDDTLWDNLDVAVDLDGNPRLRLSHVDLGCYERQFTTLILSVR